MVILKVFVIIYIDNVGFLDDMVKEEWVVCMVDNLYLMKVVSYDIFRLVFYILIEYFEG